MHGFTYKTTHPGAKWEAIGCALPAKPTRRRWPFINWTVKDNAVISQFGQVAVLSRPCWNLTANAAATDGRLRLLLTRTPNIYLDTAYCLVTREASNRWCFGAGCAAGRSLLHSREVTNVSECWLVDGVLCSRLSFVLCLFFFIAIFLCNCVQKHLWASLSQQCQENIWCSEINTYWPTRKNRSSWKKPKGLYSFSIVIFSVHRNTGWPV